ncbi:hypothetical protein CSX12_11010 [Microbacterium sp. Y-01]|nr:hypothetical protein CSX12_11010 [Microbacterium sp. Y-01]
MIATAVLLPVAVNLFTNLFSGWVANVVMLAALLGAVLLMRTSDRCRPRSAGARATGDWQNTFRRTAGMVLIGAFIGGICVLPVFPARSIEIPILNEIAHSISDDLWGSISTNGYEVLATLVIAAVAVVTLLRKRSVVPALHFTLAACAGAVAVFAATRGHVDFSEPWLTYLGIGAGAAALVGVVALSPAVVETVLHLWNRQSPESANTVSSGDPVGAVTENPRPLTRRELRRRSWE